MYGRISKTLCLVKEARHKILYSVWFHLYIFQEKSNIIHGDRKQFSVMMIVDWIGISSLG